MVLYIAYSDAGQFTACMCQISLVYISLRKRYEPTLSLFFCFFLTDPRSIKTDKRLPATESDRQGLQPWK